jgi:hypothetical protein
MESSPTRTERLWAAATHLATIPAPFLAPVAAILVQRKSRFVVSHALQALYEFLVWKAILAVAMLGSFVYTLTRLWHHYQTDWREFSLTEFALRFLAGLVILAVIGFVNTVQSLIAAKRAYTGTWPKQSQRLSALADRAAEV